MAGFTEPNEYEPRIGWRQTLADWVRTPPGREVSWQHQIAVYWRWRTLDGMSLREAWKELGMPPADAIEALDPRSPDSGLIPPELFSRVLARSQSSGIDHGATVDPVIIAKTPATEPPDQPEVGYTPAKLRPPCPPLYQPRAGWKAKVAQAPSGTGPSPRYLFELYHYWTRKNQWHWTVQEAWDDAPMHPTNADTSLNKDLWDRGSIPPELIGRVVARAQHDKISPNDKDIILYPELTI